MFKHHSAGRVGQKLAAGEIWEQLTNFQPLERFLLRGVDYLLPPRRVGKDFGQMELKIVMLLALIAAIATASYVGGRSQSQERVN